LAIVSIGEHLHVTHNPDSWCKSPSYDNYEDGARSAKNRVPAEARIAYQDFLALWKDADPDIPILKQAKAEFAKLQ